MATSLSPRERGYPEELKLSLLARKRKVAYLCNIEQTQLILGLFDKATATMQDYADFKAQLTEAIHGLRQKYQTKTSTKAPKLSTTPKQSKASNHNPERNIQRRLRKWRRAC